MRRKWPKELNVFNLQLGCAEVLAIEFIVRIAISPEQGPIHKIGIET
mgnify:CR=1 FL=1